MTCARALRLLPAALLALAITACDATPATDAGTDTGSPDVPAVVLDVGTSDAPAAADTWSSYAMGFFDTYCTECHSGPPSGRDYRTIGDVRRDAARIRCGVAPATEMQTGCGATPAPGMFPIGSGARPSDADRRRIIAWIDAGLLES